MAANEDDCVSYACECVRLAGLTDDEVIREELLKLAAIGSLRGRSITNIEVVVAGVLMWWSFDPAQVVRKLQRSLSRRKR